MTSDLAEKHTPAARPAAGQTIQLGEIGLTGYAPYLMNRIMGRYNADLRKQMNALGLSTSKMRVLAVLSVVDGLQMNELGVYSVVEQSTLSRAVDGLEAEGLVRRAADPSDQRASRVFITDAGRDTFNRLWPHMAAAYERMFRGIPEAERQAFVATLQKMLANVRKHEI